MNEQLVWFSDLSMQENKSRKNSFNGRQLTTKNARPHEQIELSMQDFQAECTCSGQQSLIPWSKYVVTFIVLYGAWYSKIDILMLKFTLTRSNESTNGILESSVINFHHKEHPTNLKHWLASNFVEEKRNRDFWSSGKRLVWDFGGYCWVWARIGENRRRKGQTGIWPHSRDDPAGLRIRELLRERQEMRIAAAFKSLTPWSE